jgi:hypothetical protein
MFAAAGPGFMQSYKDHPVELSSLVKHYLLESTDELPSLVDSTVSGGRLNVHQAINLMLTPVLASDTDSLNISLVPDSTTSASFRLINQYGLDMTFEIIPEGNPAWLSLEPSSGIIPAMGDVEITAGFDAGGLEPDVYASRIEAMNIRGDKVHVDAMMTVKDPAGILALTGVKPILKVFPNPFRQQVSISIELRNDEKIDIDILDHHGRVVRKIFDGKIPQGLANFKWDACDEQGNNLAEGIYYCRVKSGSGSSVAKLLMIR